MEEIDIKERFNYNEETFFHIKLICGKGMIDWGYPIPTYPNFSTKWALWVDVDNASIPEEDYDLYPIKVDDKIYKYKVDNPYHLDLMFSALPFYNDLKPKERMALWKLNYPIVLQLKKRN